MQFFKQARLKSLYPVRTTRELGKKKRVLMIITRLTIGGDTNVFLDIASYFAEHPDFEVQIAAGPVPSQELDLSYLALERGLTLQILPSLINQINPIVNLKAVFEVRQLIQQFKPDIVHTHSSVAGVVGRLAAFSAQVPVVVHHVHGWGIQDGMSKATRFIYIALEQFCARISDRLIAISQPNIQKGLQHRICAQSKFTLIYNGIPLDKYRNIFDEKSVRLDLGLNPEAKVVGMIGRLDPQKNPLDFIRAAAIVLKQYPSAQFVIAGEGTLRAECEKLIAELHIQDKFFLLGFRSDIDRILSVLTITVMSSLWEGLPIVFFESMSAGKPIVANDVDGACDVVISGETGFLVQPRAVAEMAERILYLLENEGECARMGHVARTRSEQFSSQSMNQSIERLYRELLS